MNKIFFALAASLLLSSCASLKKSFCDCSQGGNKEARSTGSGAGSAEHSGKSSGDKTAPAKEAGIVVDSADIEMGNRMSKSVDAFVFKNQKDEFTALCKDERFDCYVNDKRFPQGRKKIKRKVPPFLSGSKMGLQGENRVRVKYDFYP
ncbi:hypothetical protein NWE73_15735 [Bdellovibrio sp. PAP01]|uniref:Lipoprotein n=2 Tax=Bdellovibrio svalbardensis TaxID=2972972 RepID=A0ABT6DMU5_9BACT|nr:hypothetical protein [Bdellovibrio svalbardensis]